MTKRENHPRMTIVRRDLDFPIRSSRGWYVCEEYGHYYLDKLEEIGAGVSFRDCFWDTKSEARKSMVSYNAEEPKK